MTGRHVVPVVLGLTVGALIHGPVLELPAAERDRGKSSRNRREKGKEPPFRKWGAGVLATVDRDLKTGTLYAEWRTRDGKKGNEHGPYSYVWPASFQLRALAAAARVSPRSYRKRLILFADSLERYWTVKRGVGGYAVLPGASERYYDDNAWMLLGLLDTVDATRQKKYLQRAIRTLEFLVSGEKRTEGGGIRQHEDKEGGPFTCSTAPAAVGAMRIYRITKKRKYLELAERWYAWLTSPEVGVRDPGDGLYHQWAKKVDGRWEVERGKRAYQSALPLELNLLLHAATKDEKYLQEARFIADSAVKRWVRESGAIDETGQWGGSDLCAALLELHEVDGDRRWLRVVHRALEFLHEKGRDPEGRYGEEWREVRTEKPVGKVHLLYMAPVAQAYWRAAASARR
ncbi:MAG: AGE family epimerase/isomerase [Planctomycetota bacterium]|nr:AGE family epimerase/isomerase [Planctomycetota bacterium]